MRRKIGNNGHDINQASKRVKTGISGIIKANIRHQAKKASSEKAWRRHQAKR